MISYVVEMQAPNKNDWHTFVTYGLMLNEAEAVDMFDRLVEDDPSSGWHYRLCKVTQTMEVEVIR